MDAFVQCRKCGYLSVAIGEGSLTPDQPASQQMRDDPSWLRHRHLPAFHCIINELPIGKECKEAIGDAKRVDGNADVYAIIKLVIDRERECSEFVQFDPATPPLQQLAIRRDREEKLRSEAVEAERVATQAAATQKRHEDMLALASKKRFDYYLKLAIGLAGSLGLIAAARRYLFGDL